MKNIKKTIILAICFFAGLTSCSSFLEEHSPDRIPLEMAITNEEEAAQFLYAVYAKVKNSVFGLDYMAATDFMTDDIDYKGGAIQTLALSQLTHDNNNQNLRKLWSNLYAVIGQCNILIDKLETQPELSADYGKIMVAEARMMRAWAYFNLTELWGDVPLVTLPVYSIKDHLYSSRSAKKDIYSQIISDLIYARSNLPESRISVSSVYGSQTRYSYPLVLTKAAAILLLGKVYLFDKQYEDVISTLSYFASPGQYNEKYSLIPYYKLFDTRYESDAERPNEVLWEIEAKAESGYSNSYNSQVSPNSKKDPWGKVIDPGMVTRYQNVVPTYDLIKSYDVSDLRYRHSFRFILNEGLNVIVPQILKNYDITATDPDNGGANFILLRVADAYLMLAESYNELGSQEYAAYFSSRIRERAGLAPLPSDLTQQEMRAALLLERRHEFACEGSYRLFDLRRTGLYGQVMTEYSRKQTELLSLVSDEAVEEFTDMVTGNTTPAVNIPFTRVNKMWQDKFMLHPLPRAELIANPNLHPYTPNWN
ncbi:MAG: RagB/SusD family nutrient uptake outer membrane protein [Candidatus Cryptobacteroides sp.]